MDFACLSTTMQIKNIYLHKFYVTLQVFGISHRCLVYFVVYIGRGKCAL